MDHNELLIYLIIGGYIYAWWLWFSVSCVHISWGTEYSFAGTILSFLWLWYGYRNVDFFFIDTTSRISSNGLWYNVTGVMVLDVCSWYISKPYQKHIRNWLKRKKQQLRDFRLKEWYPRKANQIKKLYESLR